MKHEIEDENEDEDEDKIVHRILASGLRSRHYSAIRDSDPGSQLKKIQLKTETLHTLLY